MGSAFGTILDKSTTPKLVADLIAGLSHDERVQGLRDIPDDALRDYLNGDTTPSSYLQTILRTQFLLHHPELFKPTLSDLEPAERARYAPLFEHNEGIYQYFRRNALDAIDYEEGTRRAPAGVAIKNGPTWGAPNFDIFSNTAIVTDIPITGADQDERAKKADGFIHAIQHLLKPCANNFLIVHEGAKTYVRTDIDEKTFSVLGNMVVNAAFLESTPEELMKAMREGQARLWQNEKARALGRIGLPGVFDMAILGIPGTGFRKDMRLNDDGKLEVADDPLYDEAKKRAPKGNSRLPEVFYDGHGERVVDTTTKILSDGREIHTLTPLDHIASEGRRQLDKGLSWSGGASLLLKAIKGGTGILSTVGSAVWSSVVKGLEPGWQARQSNNVWNQLLEERFDAYSRFQTEQTRDAATKEVEVREDKQWSGVVAERLASFAAMTDASLSTGMRFRG